MALRALQKRLGSVKTRLYLIVLLPLLTLPIAVGIVLFLGNVLFDHLLANKVQGDLALARTHFQYIQKETQSSLQGIADSKRILSFLGSASGRNELGTILQSRRENLGLDFLTILDPTGRVVTPSTQVPTGQTFPALQAFAAARDSESAATGPEVLAPDVLTRIAPPLAAQARIALIDTPHAHNDGREIETRALTVVSAIPLHDDRRRVIAYAVGGVLLNRENGFVDYLSDVLSAGWVSQLSARAVATVFLDDVRIATSARTLGGERAIGTRVSDKVRTTVLLRGQRWVDHAFVVDQYAMTAYEPLTDLSGKRIGMLFVGIPERAFSSLRYMVTGTAIVSTLLLCALVAYLSWGLVKTIIRPMRAIEAAMRDFSQGNQRARVHLSDTPGGNELCHLGGLLNTLLDTISRQTLSLKEWGRSLEQKVSARTLELAQINRELDDARRAAEQASIAKSAFLANMSHEIRTPLNAITGMAHLIRRGGLTPKQTEQLNKQEQAGQHLLNIINDILDLSKIEAGKLQLHHEPVHLERVVGNVVSMLSDKARSKGLLLQADAIQASAAHLLGDPTRLQQCLLNYVGNAIKFTEHGSITIRVELAEDNPADVLLRFAVTDTGAGVDTADAPRLFSAFEQADNTATRKQGGTGLGLAITRKFAELMGGEAGFDSTPGTGSVFWFTARLEKTTLAASQPPDVSSHAEERIRAAFAGTRILLVDDDAINREIVQCLLEGLELVIDEAENGAEALRQVQTTDYALILMDVQMPHLNGIEATHLIRQLPAYAHTPILALTANAFEEDRRQCKEAGMNDLVGKPITPHTLYAKLYQWLDSGHPAGV